MSVISDLIEKVNDPDLRARLSEEVARMQKQKKFGLVFEEHLPDGLMEITEKLRSFIVSVIGNSFMTQRILLSAFPSRLQN